MKTEFNLSSTIYDMHGVKVCQVDHVKEFIKRLKGFVKGRYSMRIQTDFCTNINKLAGGELV